MSHYCYHLHYHISVAMLSYSSALARIAACSATRDPSLSCHPTPRLFFVLILPMSGSVCFRRQRLRGRRCRAPRRRAPRLTTRMFERLPPCSLDLSEDAQEANGELRPRNFRRCLHRCAVKPVLLFLTSKRPSKCPSCGGYKRTEGWKSRFQGVAVSI